MMDPLQYAVFGFVIHLLSGFMLQTMDEDHERTYPFVMCMFTLLWWIILFVKYL